MGEGSGARHGEGKEGETRLVLGGRGRCHATEEIDRVACSAPEPRKARGRGDAKVSCSARRRVCEPAQPITAHQYEVFVVGPS